MSEKLTFESFAEFLSSRCKAPVEEITVKSSFTEDLGIDSLTIYSIMTDVEKEYGIKLEFEDILAMNLVGTVYEQIRERLSTSYVS
ncbi:MAG: acyl carrier protein [Bacillota bacterium]|nr:acyl carrier protein [Bacillota bacterium]